MYRKTIRKIKKLSLVYSRFSDEKLKMETNRLKKKYLRGRTLESILPEAYAVVIEALNRYKQIKLYDVQIEGAIYLSMSSVIEMKTGEGKTYTATLPLYLHSLTGKSTILVTTNDYLSERDGKDMSEVFSKLAQSVGIRIGDELTSEEKKEIYQNDIVYVSSSSLGFDYLIDNLSANKKDKFLPKFYCAIVDEADEVLLDFSQNPLIISGAKALQSNAIYIARDFVRTLTKEEYKVNLRENSVYLTSNGVEKLHRFFRVENIFDGNYDDILLQVNLALQADKLYELNEKYVINNNEIVLLDMKTGRLLPGTKLQKGLHQALEAKENVPITEQTRPIATITYQSLFNKFHKLSGMSGTAKTVEDELYNIYKLNVKKIKTNKKVIRIDKKDLIYQDFKKKTEAIINEVLKLNARGRPVLVITESLETSRLYSNLLFNLGVKNNLLNAKSKAYESEIISKAGISKSVTISTKIAGRGTDIKLDSLSKDAGGLAVIVTEHLNTKRMDLQAIGRSGRQGDPGTSRFYSSSEDNLFLEYDPNYAKKISQKFSMRLNKKVKKMVKRVQSYNEESKREEREVNFQYDFIIGKYRDSIYDLKNDLLFGKNIDNDMFNKICLRCFDILTERKKKSELTAVIFEYIRNHVDYNFDSDDMDIKQLNRLDNFFVGLMNEVLNRKRVMFRDEEDFNHYKSVCFIKSIDSNWTNFIDEVYDIKDIVSDRFLSKDKPMYYFGIEVNNLFKNMLKSIYLDFLENISLSEIVFVFNEETGEKSIDIIFE